MSIKNFELNEEKDFLFYLTELLIATTRYLNSFERSTNELGIFINESEIRIGKKPTISEEVYQEFRDKINFSSNYLLNIIGDHADFALSYQNYRKAAKKKNISVFKLSDEEQKQLNEITTQRNWVAHIPASLLNSYSKKEHDIESFDEKDVIYYVKFNNYTSEWLIDLYKKSTQGVEMFKEWLEIMKKEYKLLTNKSCILKTFEIDLRPLNDLMPATISSKIQNKQIKNFEELKQYYKKESDSKHEK